MFVRWNLCKQRCAAPHFARFLYRILCDLKPKPHLTTSEALFFVILCFGSFLVFFFGLGSGSFDRLLRLETSKKHFRKTQNTSKLQNPKD